MKTPDCFEAYRPIVLLIALAVLSGCEKISTNGSGSGGGCASGIPVASSLETSFDSFTIDANSSSNPAGATLDRTLFRQFFRAAEPADGAPSEADSLYEFMGSETDTFTRFDDPDSLPDYQSVRNGFDLLEAMIAVSGRYEPIQTIRDAMASCARDTQQAFDEGKDSRAGSIALNNITVTDPPEDEDGDPTEWGFSINYAHSPNPLEDPTSFGPNVRRVLFTPESFIFTLYDYEQFTGNGAASGFKQPGKLIAGFNAQLNDTLDSDEDSDDESAPSVIFESFPLEGTQDDRQDERGETDRWSWSSSQATTVATPDNGDIEAKCIRLTVDYGDNNAVLAELAESTCPGISDPENFTADATFSYDSANPDTIQTR